jgi:hypothetical protein
VEADSGISKPVTSTGNSAAFPLLILLGAGITPLNLAMRFCSRRVGSVREQCFVQIGEIPGEFESVNAVPGSAGTHMPSGRGALQVLHSARTSRCKFMSSHRAASTSKATSLQQQSNWFVNSTWNVRIPVMSISYSDLMPISSERSDAGPSFVVVFCFWR